MNEINEKYGNVVKDTLAIDKFIHQIANYTELQTQLGTPENVLMLNKASMIIRILTHHCMSYGIGIPAVEIVNVVNDRR